MKDKALERLKKELREQKIYHRIIAERLGVDRTTVTHWLNGTKDINYKYLKFISEEMAGIMLADLFEESDTIYRIKVHLRKLSPEDRQYVLRFLPSPKPTLELPEPPEIAQ